MKASLHLHTKLRSGKTVLHDTFFSAPFKLADLSDREDSACRVMIMNAAPGVLDGDKYDLQIQVDAGCSLVVETQAYQRIFHMEGSARQEMTIRLGDDACFSYLPHPTVPHAQAHFTGTNTIYLERSSLLIWGEVLTPGRNGQERPFSFRNYQSRTKVFQEGRLVVTDNLVVRPVDCDVISMGLLESYTHQASFLFLAPDGYRQELECEIKALLADTSGISWGLSRLPVPGLLVRLLGTKAEPLFNCLKRLGSQLLSQKIHRTSYAP